MWHGCAMVHSRYPDRSGTSDIFEYSVDAIANLGFSATMSYANSGFDQDYSGEDFGSPLPSNFTELLQTPMYHYLFESSGLNRHVIQLWTFANGPQSDPPAVQASASQMDAEYQEIYDACVYLLSTYSGKEIILKNWEGDWQLLTDFNPALSIPASRVNRYAAWANKRQKAVHDAVRDTPSTTVIKYCVELNRCLDDFGFRLHRDVLPLVKPDMVGWSAYEAINEWTDGWVREAPDTKLGSSNILCMATDGNGTIVIGATGGKLSVSKDNGKTFYLRDTTFGGAFSVTGVAYDHSTKTWCIVGAGAKVAQSNDAINWNAGISGNPHNFAGVVTDNAGTFIGYGSGAAVYYSTDGGFSWSHAFWNGTPLTSLANLTRGYCDQSTGICIFGSDGGHLVYYQGGGTTNITSGAGLGSNAVRAITSDGNRFVVGADGGVITTSDAGLGQTFTAQTSQFSSDAILGLAYGLGVFVAVGTNGKISTSTDGLTWTARTSGTGAYLNGCNFSTTEQTFVYACDGATGYSLNGIDWAVNGQDAMGGVNVNHDCVVSGAGVTLTGSDAGLATVAKYWHPQSAAEANTDFLLKKGLARIRANVPIGTPVAITEYGYPQDQSNFTGIGLDVGRLIQRVVDTATAENVAGLIWWQIFDNEEQSAGVPRGFHLYSRNGNSSTPGALSGAGVKYQSIL